MPVYGGTNQVYAVTAGTTVPAAFAGVHRNHHFDTIQRLHPLLHPLNTGDAPSPFDIGLDYSSFCRWLQSSLFFHQKRDINAPRSIQDINNVPVRKQAHYSVEIPFALGCRLYGYMEKLHSCIRDSEAITIILHQVSQDHQ